MGKEKGARHWDGGGGGGCSMGRCHRQNKKIPCFRGQTEPQSATTASFMRPSVCCSLCK